MFEKQSQLICVTAFTLESHTSYHYIIGMRMRLSTFGHQPSYPVLLQLGQGPSPLN